MTSRRSTIFVLIATGLLSAILLAPMAASGQEPDSRGVRIIDGAPAQPPPDTTGPSLTPGLTAPVPPPAAFGPIPPAADIDIRHVKIRADNPAGLELEILPDLELSTGTKVYVRVATKKPGYLILVDVDPTGKLTQIYPNRHMLERRDNPEGLNLTKAGQSLTIPNRVNPYAGFEFVASPPAGVAMLVAILSDRPVHLVDLPDIGAPASGQAAFDQLREVARGLRIPRGDGVGVLDAPTWSFDAKLYVVK